MGQKVTPLYAETRILLNLWALDDSNVTKSKFMPSSKSAAYKQALQKLELENVLSAYQKTKRSKVYSITESGKQRLAKGLTNEDFRFPAQVGAKTANAVIRWFRQQDNVIATTTLQHNGDSHLEVNPINSYEAFVELALTTYDQLNQDYNMDNLVPIYRIRRQIGERVTRSEFSAWLLKMQSNDLFQLLEGSVEDSAPDKIEDSITTKMGKLRCYAKRLSI